MNRREHILKKVNIKKGIGLEIGPLHQPILKKEEAQVFYLDHMSGHDLRKKYKTNPYFDVNDIVGVDYILSGNNKLKDAVPKNKKFDYVIASHVIEHIPDTVSWFEDIAFILNSGGIFTLAIPNKLYTFDVGREVSRPSEVIGAYADKISKPTSSMIYDHFSEARDVNNTQKSPTNKQVLGAWRSMQENLTSKECIDAHYYVYTPASFLNIMRHLMIHELVDFEVVYFHDSIPGHNDFYVSLKKISGNRGAKKQLASLPKISDYTQDPKIELEKLKGELAAVYGSVSWRLTKSLRDAVSVFRRT